MLEFMEYGDGLGAAGTVLREHANRNGPQAAVPTCPGWTLRDLVAHQGAVHRWAAGVIRTGSLDTVDADASFAEGLADPDQLTWFDEGARALLQALADAPEDLDVPFFLAGDPPPLMGWARRQCHETTIHAVDAMSASFGRAPLPAETWLGPRLAADGVDELLTGFLPRRRHRLRSESPITVRVESTDTGQAWTLSVSAEPVTTVRGGEASADVVLSGTAVELYLGLWNRSDGPTSSDPGFLTQWRDQMQVSWR
ncbi:maleylpyruvate isomerase family mycothiol-dependent enzyme [Nocardioides insulae]|uniref:maleylpyruvate isomerase family mycothiol-dependent enzyme n=1 Tax=Nocardioides insulae TaxID=394734 RepID=UPI00040F42B9|nr:maleylpyruvate isomerase family mycothiol-dependent enzyme [Nocardioides insulae]